MTRSLLDRHGPARILAAPPLAFFGLGAMQLLLRESIRLVDLLFAVVPGMTLLVGTYAVTRSSVSPGRYERIRNWVVVGALVTSLVPIVVVQTPYVSTDGPHVPLMIGLWLGATGGLVAGFQEARAIEQAQRSERERVRADLAERERSRLEHLNHLLRHDILNNVTVIQARAAHILEADEQYEREHIEAIERQAGSISELIQNVRSYIESVQTKEGERKPKALSAVLSAEVASLESTFPDCTVTTEIPDDVSVLADDLLNTVFSNLLWNAVVHNTAASPEVAVSVTVDESAAAVRIEDNGPGISTAILDDLYEPSSSGDHGFGLYLVKTLVDRYDGTMTVETGSESGTTFVVTVPLASSTTTSPA